MLIIGETLAPSPNRIEGMTLSQQQKQHDCFQREVSPADFRELL